MTARRRTTCRDCGTELTNSVSLRYGHGTECIKKLSPAEKAAALVLTAQENDPTYIPPDKKPTIEARLTNAAARRTIEEARNPDTCDHGGLLGECMRCRQKEDLAWCVQQVITVVQADRARGERHPLRPWPLPYVRHTKTWTTDRPRRRQRRDTGQLTLENA